MTFLFYGMINETDLSNFIWRVEILHGIGKGRVYIIQSSRIISIICNYTGGPTWRAEVF